MASANKLKEPALPAAAAPLSSASSARLLASELTFLARLTSLRSPCSWAEASADRQAMAMAKADTIPVVEISWGPASSAPLALFFAPFRLNQPDEDAILTFPH